MKFPKTESIFLLFICYGIFIIISIPLYAQQTKTDSLENSLKNSKPDTNRVNILSQLAWGFMTSDLEKSKQYTLRGLKLSRNLGFLKGEVILLNYLGDYHRRQGAYANGVKYITQSLKVAEGIKDSLGMADAYRLLGIIHSFSLNQYELGLKYHIMALPIYEKSKDKRRIIALYGHIAWVLYMMNRDMPLARQYTEKALSLVKNLDDNQLMSWALNSKALIYSRESKLDSAIFYLNKSNEFAQKAKDQAVNAYNNNLLGNIYLQQNDHTNALKIFQKNIPLIHKVNAKGLLSNAYESLSKTYVAQGKFDSAYVFYKKYIHLKDSLHNWETSQKVAIIQAEYEKERKEAKILSLEKERSIYSVVFGVVFLALLIVLLLVIRNNQQRMRANGLLQEKNEEIAQQNEELQQSREEISTQRDLVTEKNKELEALNTTKDKLFAIIGHDLLSPLNSLKGLMGLVNNQELSSKDFMLFAGKLRDSVDHVHFTLNNLLIWANAQMQGLTTDPQIINIHRIGEENINLFSQLAIMKEIDLSNMFEENTHVYADPDQINLVIRNLINNAIKFTQSGGIIRLQSKTENGVCEISISDTGIGMDDENIAKLFKKANHFTTQGTSGEKGSGLGLLLCQEMIRENGGKIWVESEPGKGSTFKFTLPVLSA